MRLFLAHMTNDKPITVSEHANEFHIGSPANSPLAIIINPPASKKAFFTLASI